VDCADPDCAHAPECRPHEICGNCIDDDGDGLVDYEDADCCSQGGALVIERMTLEPAGLKLRGNRLAMKARYATSVPPLFDPLAQDTTLQMSDAHGPLFCQTIARAQWKRPHRRRYRFEDRRGRFAGGLETGRFQGEAQRQRAVPRARRARQPASHGRRRHPGHAARRRAVHARDHEPPHHEEGAPLPVERARRPTLLGRLSVHEAKCKGTPQRTPEAPR